MNYQSQQAIQVFYGDNCPQSDISNVATCQYVYGPLAVLKSTGAHPTNDYRVYPFTDELYDLTRKLFYLLTIKRLNSREFNSMEVKIYIGDDMFEDEAGNLIEDANGFPLRAGCNKCVNSHNDLVFNDDGVQSASDTACGTQHTVTLSIGSTRQITFEHMTKKIDERCWSKSGPDTNKTFDLDHGSLFVLAPEDDKPTKIRRTGEILHKTKHRVDFQGKGVSIAFVFRCVDKSSKFDTITNQWLWNDEGAKVRDRVSRYLQDNESKFSTFNARSHVAEMKKLSENIERFVASLE